MSNIMEKLGNIFTHKQELPENTRVRASWPFPVGTTEEKAEHIERVSLMEDAISNGIKLCHAFDPFNHYGGVTIAYRKTVDYKNTRMVEIAVSYCSKHDAFNKKIGNELAVTRFLDGNTIIVPAGLHGEDFIPNTLKKMFWYSIYANYSWFKH